MVAIELKHLKMQDNEIGGTCPDCGEELVDGVCPNCNPEDDIESLDEAELDEDEFDEEKI